MRGVNYSPLLSWSERGTSPPDVFLSAHKELWERDLPLIAGYEPMSEPRSKIVPQGTVRHFYEGVCGTIAAVDARTHADRPRRVGC